MSDELIKSLEKRVQDLQKEKEALSAEQARRRNANKQLTEQVEALTKERDEWKGKAEAAPGEMAKELSQLKEQVRTRKHQDAWDAQVKEIDGGEGKKLRLHEKATVQSLWRELNYTPTGEPDTEAITELVGKARESHPYLFQPVETGNGSGEPARLAVPSGSASGRGKPDNGGSGKLRVNREDLQNPRTSSSVLERIAKARSEGQDVEFVGAGPRQPSS